MRRTISAITASVLALVLTGCGMTDEELVQKRDYCVAHGGKFVQNVTNYGYCDFTTEGTR